MSMEMNTHVVTLEYRSAHVKILQQGFTSWNVAEQGAGIVASCSNQCRNAHLDKHTCSVLQMPRRDRTLTWIEIGVSRIWLDQGPRRGDQDHSFDKQSADQAWQSPTLGTRTYLGGGAVMD